MNLGINQTKASVSGHIQQKTLSELSSLLEVPFSESFFETNVFVPGNDFGEGERHDKTIP
jgi:hypothetical protein